MKNNTLASEAFSRAGKHYFLDFKVAENNSNYIQITRSDWQSGDTYKRSQVIIFQEDFHFLIQAFASLFQSAAYLDNQNEGARDIYMHKKKSKENGIKSWEPELRPREKLQEKGAGAMHDAELLAMLIGSGTPDETAVSLAQRILDSTEQDLSDLSHLGFEELGRFHGMGMAKSSAIIAAMELGRRAFSIETSIRRICIANGIYVAP
jgi:hypothetical protein